MDRESFSELFRTVLIDCDGVLSDFDRTCYAYAREYGYTGSVDGTVWSTSERYPADVYRYICMRLDTESPAETMEVLPGAVEFIENIKAHGLNPIICTSPWTDNITWCFDRYEWLRRHFGINPKQVMYTHQKQLVNGLTLIDDKYENCKKWNIAHPNKQALWLAPYLADQVSEIPVKRVKSYDEIMQELIRLTTF